MKIIGVETYDGPFQRAVDNFLIACQEPFNGQARCVSASDAHVLVQSYLNKSFADALNGFVLNLPDGMPVVWLGRLKGAKQMERCYGPHFFAEVMRHSAGRPITHFLCGGKEGVAGELKDVCEKRFGNHNCVGTFSPPFHEVTDSEMRSLCGRIDGSGADIVWIGLSTPKQHLFASRMSKYVKAKFIVTVGAAFDFHTGRVREAPAYLQPLGLEWAFRLAMEPRRLFGRYIKVVPLFIVLAAMDVVGLLGE